MTYTTATISMLPSEFIDEIEKVLLEGGWVRNNFGPAGVRSDPHCLFGAARCVELEQRVAASPYFLPFETVKRDVLTAIVDTIKRKFNVQVEVGVDLALCITYFNDLMAKSVDDVMDVLHDARLALKEQGK